MKKIYVILVLFFLSFLSFGQNFNVSYSQMTPNSYFTTIESAGKIGNSIYQIKRDKKGLYLDIYDASKMNLISSKLFKARSCETSDCIDKHFDYVKTSFMKDAILMFFETYDRKADERILFAQKVDLKGNFEGKLVQIDKIDTKKRSEGSFNVWQSEDSTKIMVINNPPFEKYNNEKFGFKIYSSNLKNLYNLGITLPYKDKNVSVIDFYLGNDNKIYMLTRVNLEKDKKVKGQAPFFFSILTVNAETNALSEFKVNLPSKNIEDIVLRLDKSSKFVTCAGFYSDLKPREYVGNDIDGFFYMTIDAATQQITTKGTKAIDKNMVAELMDIKNSKKIKADQGISNDFEIRNIKKRSDGTTTLIAEYRKVVVTTYTTCSQNGGCSTHTSYTFYRENVFVVNLATDGSVMSFIDIPKKQITVNDGGMFSSFLTYEKGDNLYLIYNDNPENLDANIRIYKDTKPMPRINKACLVAVGINSDGSYTKTKIHDNYTKKMISMPESGMKVGDGEYIIPAQEPLGACVCACTIMFKKILKGFIKITM